MNSNTQKGLIVVGAGMAGLCAAYQGVKQGFSVRVVERADTVGGLARSISVNDCLLDVGPHLLFLRDAAVAQAVREVVDEKEILLVKRRGKIFMAGRSIDWPIRFKSLFQIPPGLGLRIVLDQLRTKPSDNGNYRSAMLATYGETLYKNFFGPLTKKFLKEDPVGIHPEWAFASLRAATKLDEPTHTSEGRYNVVSSPEEQKREFGLFTFLRKSLFPGKATEEFYYFRDGFGTLPGSFARAISGKGGEIMLNSSVDAIGIHGDRIASVSIGGRPYDCDYLFWTGSLLDLATLLKIDIPRLHYLHTKFVYIFTSTPMPPFQCCYYADPSVSFNRATILSNHSRSILRNKRYKDVICLEYTFRNREEMTKADGPLLDRAINDLVRLNVIESRDPVVDSHILNVPFTYPILHVGYREIVAQAESLLGRFTNLYTAGRQAAGEYSNSDLIIKGMLNHPLFRPFPMEAKA